MPQEYSPFTPGQPVPVEFFVGRSSEVQEIARMVELASTGRFSIGFLTGERGIGKSSLASFVRYFGEREHNVLGVHVFLGGVHELPEMARRAFDRLLKESIDRPWHQKVRSFLGNHVRQVGLFGITVEFAASSQDLQQAVHDFAPSIKRLAETIEENRKGVFLILDDINGLAQSEAFANWLKSLVDEIATSAQPCPFCLLLVGLEERRQTLVQHQPSLARVFRLVEITPWSDGETRQFFEKAFASIHVRMAPGALQTLTTYTGGFPAVAHEIGDAVLRVDTDGYIDARDALQGVVSAADVIGRKHLEPQVYRAIRSERYRAILRKVAREPFGPQFRRAEIMRRLPPAEKRVLDNFLNRMKRLGVVVPDAERGRGAYRFINRLHYLYFWMEAQRTQQSRV